MDHRIRLTAAERKKLLLRTRGKRLASEALRAHILLRADRGMSVATIALELTCGTATVKRVKARYRAEGWLSAITAKKPPGRIGLDVHVMKLVVATACTPPPDGAPRWTIRMLSRKMKVPKSCVQRILAADGLKPWREKNVVYSENRSGVSPTTV